MCDGTAYESVSNNLYSLSLGTTGSSNLITANLPAGVNALAFHPQDNFLYAVTQTLSKGASVVRIGQNGISNAVPNSNIPQFNASATSPYMASGDIDNNFSYWIAYNSGQNWVQIDLNNASPTYGQVIGSGIASGLSTNIAVSDWAYIPTYPNRLYTLGGQVSQAGVYTTYLLFFDLISKSWSTVFTYTPASGGTSGKAQWGAVYSTSDGYLYATENNSGGIYKVSITSPGLMNYLTSAVSQGIVGGSNDGARCMNGPITVTKKRTVDSDVKFAKLPRGGLDTQRLSRKKDQRNSRAG
ncbi:hypothetical protein VMCG_08029 [Cytospora schulzeri]|uniref:DUF6923 domain-containing protein n=1 Tax=Cytospora schulzeri TaxID=448051 RepID=A0A423VY64_9PEZI|nr:hypothetical protein VMCG_08029 [Valsa malicola]